MASSNKYLDLSGNDQVSNKNGANAQLWDMDGRKDRLLKFLPKEDLRYYNIQFQNGGRMLDVGGYWKLTDMSIPYQGLYLAGKSDKKLKKDKGANVQAWENNGKDNQLWRIVPIGNNNYAIINKHSGKALDVTGSELNKNGANLRQWNFEPSHQSQQWKNINESSLKTLPALIFIKCCNCTKQFISQLRKRWQGYNHFFNLFRLNSLIHLLNWN